MLKKEWQEPGLEVLDVSMTMKWHDNGGGHEHDDGSGHGDGDGGSGLDS